MHLAQLPRTLKPSRAPQVPLVRAQHAESIVHEAEIGARWGCHHAGHWWWLLGWHRGTKGLVPCHPHCPTSHPGGLCTEGVLLVQEQPPNPVPSPSPPATEQPPGAGHHRCHRGALLEPSQVWKAPSDFPLPGSGERLRRVPAEGLCYLQLLAARRGHTANGEAAAGQLGAVSVAAPLTPESPQMCTESCACTNGVRAIGSPWQNVLLGVGRRVWGCGALRAGLCGHRPTTGPPPQGARGPQGELRQPRLCCSLWKGKLRHGQRMWLSLGHGGDWPSRCTLAWVGRRCQHRGVRGTFFWGGGHCSKSAPWRLGCPKHRGFSAWGKPLPPAPCCTPGSRRPPFVLGGPPPASRTEPFPPLRAPLRPLCPFKRTPGVAAGLSSCPRWTRDWTAPDSPGRVGTAATTGTAASAGTRADPVGLGGAHKKRGRTSDGDPHSPDPTGVLGPIAGGARRSLGTFVTPLGWHWMSTLIGDGGSMAIWGGRRALRGEAACLLGVRPHGHGAPVPRC